MTEIEKLTEINDSLISKNFRLKLRIVTLKDSHESYIRLKDTEISNLKTRVTLYRDKIPKLQRRLSERDTKIEKLWEQIKKLEELLELKHKEISKSKDYIEKLELIRHTGFDEDLDPVDFPGGRMV